MLSGAGLLAHGITALAMPVLSRLYAPADFGLLSVLTSALGILGVAACLRYEVAIALPGDPDDGDHLLLLALAVCTVLSLAACVVVLLAPGAVLAMLKQPALSPFLWMLPLGLWLTGCYAALQAWHVRQAAFGILARTRVGQSGTSAGLQIAGGWLAVGPAGLLAGPLWNTGVACAALCRPAWRALGKVRWSRLTQLALDYRRFPLYSTAEAVANSAALYLPVIVIAAHAGPAEAGFLGMAMYVAQAPMSLIGNSISQVFLSRAAEEHRQGRLAIFAGEVLDGLVKAGTGPLLALGIVAPPLCGWIFGPGWDRTGWLVSWMTPWFLMQFLVVPMSMGLHICGRQRTALALQLVGLVVRFGAIWALASLGTGRLSEAYAVTGLLFYGLYLAVVLRVVGVPWRRLPQALRASWRVTLGWVAVAAAGSLALTLVRGGG